MNPIPIIHIVDDDDSFRRATARLLQAAGHAVQCYASAAEFLLARGGETPGCVVLDVQMPDLNGLELQAAMAKQGTPFQIVFVTGHGDIPMSVQAMKTGAVDFLTKPVKREQLLQAVHAAMARDARLRSADNRVHQLSARLQRLTPRERDVLGRVMTGKLNKEIAAELGAAERTVKAHRASIMEKMQAQSVAELAHFAAELELHGINVQPPAHP